MTRADKVKILIMILSGFLTWLLQNIFPVDGGGASLIFVLTVPFLIVLSIGFSYFYYWKTTKQASIKTRNIIFSISLFLSLFLSFSLYPCSQDDSPCPCETIAMSIKVVNRYNDIKFQDLFLEPTKKNYPIIVAAQKKYRNEIPDKFFYVVYQNKETDSSAKEFVIYFRKSKVHTTNSDLQVILEKDRGYIFSEVVDSDTILFKSGLTDFKNFSNSYKNSPANNHGSYETESKNYTVYISEGENESIYYYWFYRMFYSIL